MVEVLSLALQHHQAGRLSEAEALYRQILQAQPNHADALHLLGVIAHQVGKHEIAVEYITRAIALNPTAAEYHSNIGEAYRALARLNEAEASFQQALALKPATAEAMNNLGAVLQAQDKLEEAVAHYQRAVALKPNYAEAHNNLGTALHKQGQSEGAIAQYRQAIALKPDYVQAILNLCAAQKGPAKSDDPIQNILSRFLSGPKDPIFDRMVLSYDEQVYVRGKPRRYLECTCRLLSFFAERSNRSMRDLVIVEIGTMSRMMSHGFDGFEPRCCTCGHSTAFWARTGAATHTVDVNPDCPAALSALCQEYPNLAVHTEDGCRFLKEFGKPIDLLYLDAWDVNPAMPYAAMHAEAYEAARPRLAATCIVSIDDTDVDSGGKGRLVIPLLVCDGFEIVAYGRQTIAVRLGADKA